MDEELKKLVKKNLEVSEQTLAILKKLNRAHNISRFLKILKWMVIIAITLGFYYYAQPYINTFWETLYQIKNDFSGLKNMSNSVKNVPVGTVEKIQDLLPEPK